MEWLSIESVWSQEGGIQQTNSSNSPETCKKTTLTPLPVKDWIYVSFPKGENR